MSILIRGMDMPEVEDGKCIRIVDAAIHVYANGEEEAALYVYDENGKAVGRFPIVSVPTHGRLVDADDILSHGLGDARYKEVVRRVLMQAPTIIESEDDG